MESENECNPKETSVKDLQTALFPVTPRGYLANFLLKPITYNSDDDEDRFPKVKESQSRDLFAINRDQTCTSQPPRWPTECQVLGERVLHITYTPSVPEGYYIPTGNEVQPRPVGEECGIVIYQYYPISAVNYFSRSSVGGSKYLLPTCPTPEDDSLRFESRFESGNLAKAIRITECYYELYLRTDLYTNKHMQWFYFRVSNMKKRTYRFSIVNLTKEESLYNEGMKPLMYSKRDSQLHSIGWRHCGENITYYCNDNVTPEDPDQQMTYTLTFTIEFPHEDDEVYFAHSYPYTYSDLQDYLMEMSTHPIKSTYSTLRLLCRTLAGNNVYYVTITSPPVPGDNKKKRAVVITARVHPGEAPASWMMKGFLDFLTSESAAAKELRNNFIFKLVPMLNPDGVIVGNNRCSLTGRDLNRQYRTVIRETYPSIWYTKLMVRRLLEECGVAMYCDLHAHSRKHNIFVYGCESRRGSEKKLLEQVFPLMLHKNAADKFSFENCHFRIQKSKEGTGRVVMWMMGIANSYTMEATFGGSSLGNRADSHFSAQDYEQMGRVFCQTLLDFYDNDPSKERLRFKIVSRLITEGSNAEVPTNIQISDYSSDEGDTSTSSSEFGLKPTYPETALIVPPPSPIIKKKQKQHTNAKNKKNVKSKLPSIPRKPLPLPSTTVELALSKKVAFYISDTSGGSESDTEGEGPREKIKPVRRKKKKKKSAKKKQKDNIHPDLELDYQTKKCTQQGVTVVDILPVEKYRSHSWHRSLVVSSQKTLVDSKKITTQQLVEVQAKLVSLKNRLWLGVGGDLTTPLSWGTTNFTFAPRSAPVEEVKAKLSRKKSIKPEKTDKKGSKKSKQSAEQKEKHQKKTQNGLKRPTNFDWMIEPAAAGKIWKTKSLPETALYKNKVTQGVTSDGDVITSQSKTTTKKKKKTKFVKKAKTVSTANVFIRKG